MDMFSLDRFVRVPLRRALLATTVSAVLLLGTMAPAKAYLPPCTVEPCPIVAPAMWTLYSTTVIEFFEQYFIRSFMQEMNALIDAMTLHANQETNNTQHLQNLDTVRSDKYAATVSANKVAQQRTDLVKEISPSPTGCVAGSYTKEGNAGTYGKGTSKTSRDATVQSEADVGKLLANGGQYVDGSHVADTGSNGQLAYLNSRYAHHLQYYNNQNATELTSSPSYGADLDVQPFPGIFEQINIKDGQEYEVARDNVLNLIGDVVYDPVRGSALNRVDGQNLAVERWEVQAKMNLVSSVLMGAIQRRREFTGPDGNKMRSNQSVEVGTSNTTYNTLQGKELNEITGSLYSASYDKLAATSMAQTMAGQTKGQNLDQVASMMMDEGRQLLTIYTLLEQMAAIHAVNLAMDVKENRSAGSLAARSAQ